MPRYSAVTTATRLEAAVQIDGRIAVRERHATDFGDTEDRIYIAPAGSDAAALDAMLEANAEAYLQRLAGQ